jgi:hypothetical protein
MTGRLVRLPNGAPAAGPVGDEALVLRALGDAYADRTGGGTGAAWPTLSELTARAALPPEAVRSALRGLERWGLLRLCPGGPPPATIVRGPPPGAPQPAGGIGPAPSPSAASGPYSASGSTPSAFASLRTVDG